MRLQGGYQLVEVRRSLVTRHESILVATLLLANLAVPSQTPKTYISIVSMAPSLTVIDNPPLALIAFAIAFGVPAAAFPMMTDVKTATDVKASQGHQFGRQQTHVVPMRQPVDRKSRTTLATWPSPRHQSPMLSLSHRLQEKRSRMRSSSLPPSAMWRSMQSDKFLKNLETRFLLLISKI